MEMTGLNVSTRADKVGASRVTENSIAFHDKQNYRKVKQNMAKS